MLSVESWCPPGASSVHQEQGLLNEQILRGHQNLIHLYWKCIKLTMRTCESRTIHFHSFKIHLHNTWCFAPQTREMGFTKKGKWDCTKTENQPLISPPDLKWLICVIEGDVLYGGYSPVNRKGFQPKKQAKIVKRNYANHKIATESILHARIPRLVRNFAPPL